MALDFTFNTPVTDQTGDVISSAYGRLGARILDDEQTIKIALTIHKTEIDRDNGRNDLTIDEIPRDIMQITFLVTGGEWSAVDMAAWHDDYIDILKEGSAAPKYPPAYDQSWLGLEAIDPLNTVVKTMPV